MMNFDQLDLTEKLKELSDHWKQLYLEQYNLAECLFDMLVHHKVLDHDSLIWHDRKSALIEQYRKTHVPDNS